MKIKALNIALKPLCCKCTQVCEYVNIAWALGSKVPPPPYSNSSRSMALDNSRLPTGLSVQPRKTKQKGKKMLQRDE